MGGRNVCMYRTPKTPKPNDASLEPVVSKAFSLNGG